MDDIQREKLKQMFGQMSQDNNKAVDIASRSPLAQTSPEEQQFSNQQLGPLMQGLIGGGTAGSLGKATVQEAPAAAQGFGKLKNVFQAAKPIAQQDAAPMIDMITGEAIHEAPQYAPMLKTSASLPSTHPAMIGERQAIGHMEANLGSQHPDVISRQQNYNNILGGNQ